MAQHPSHPVVGLKGGVQATQILQPQSLGFSVALQHYFLAPHLQNVLLISVQLFQWATLRNAKAMRQTGGEGVC